MIEKKRKSNMKEANNKVMDRGQWRKFAFTPTSTKRSKIKIGFFYPKTFNIMKSDNENTDNKYTNGRISFKQLSLYLHTNGFDFCEVLITKIVLFYRHPSPLDT